MPVTNRDGGVWAVLFGLGLLLLLVVQQLLSRRAVPSLPPGGVLVSLPTTRSAIEGVEGRTVVRCPRRAQALLAQHAAQNRRAVTFREGARWEVLHGTHLRVPPADPADITAYYLRDGAPITDDDDRTTTGAACPEPPPGYRAVPHGALAPGSARVIQRFDKAEHAAAALGPPDATRVILFNGPHDPSYYAIQTDGPARVVADAALPGTLYVAAA